MEQTDPSTVKDSMLTDERLEEKREMLFRLSALRSLEQTERESMEMATELLQWRELGLELLEVIFESWLSLEPSNTLYKIARQITTLLAKLKPTDDPDRQSNL
jgi:hypothetical protein